MKILKFPLISFLTNVFAEAKKRQDDIQRRKIEYLYQETYRYYLDLYLVKTVNDVDFPQFMYETGLIICKEAKEAALKVMLQVIEEGRVNKCYTKRLESIKKLSRRLTE